MVCLYVRFTFCGFKSRHTLCSMIRSRREFSTSWRVCPFSRCLLSSKYVLNSLLLSSALAAPPGNLAVWSLYHFLFLVWTKSLPIALPSWISCSCTPVFLYHLISPIHIFMCLNPNKGEKFGVMQWEGETRPDASDLDPRTYRRSSSPLPALECCFYTINESAPLTYLNQSPPFQCTRDRERIHSFVYLTHIYWVSYSELGL